MIESFDLDMGKEEKLTEGLGRGRGGVRRYVTRRLAGGTKCDKTGMGREVEMRFYCDVGVSQMSLFFETAGTDESRSAQGVDRLSLIK